MTKPSRHVEHQRLAREVLLHVDEALAGRVDEARLAKTVALWEDARSAKGGAA